MAHERPGYWGSLTSAQLTHLYQEVNTTALHRLQSPARLVTSHVSGAVLPLRPDGLVAPAGLYLLAHPAEARIYVICDNARYYKNKNLRAWLADKPICQVFLPPYSSNLNLIERLWEYLRQKIINATFYRTKDQFRVAMLDFFNRLPDFEPDLASLLTRKFHILDAQPTS